MSTFKRKLAVALAVAAAIVAVAVPANASSGEFPRWINVSSQLCMGASGGKMTAGTPIIQWWCNGNDDQYWSWTFAEEGDYQPLLNNKDNNKCLDVLGSSSDAGAKLILADCNGSDSQRWAHFNEPVLGGSLLKNKHSGLVIGTSGGNRSIGTPLIQWPWSGVSHPDEEWIL